MEPKFGDFGTAKFVSEPNENPTSSVTVGTLGCIAPGKFYIFKKRIVVVWLKLKS